MSFKDELEHTVASAMPDNAEINGRDRDGGMDLFVMWPLENDPDRVNKMSKTIHLWVTREVFEDLSEASDRAQTDALQRLEAFLAAKLGQFNPDHDTPREVPVPVERWTVTPADVIQQTGRH